MIVKHTLVFLKVFFIILLLYFSALSQPCHVHLSELSFLSTFLIWYTFYQKRNSFFLSYLLSVFTAQTFFTLYMCFGLSKFVSLTGGVAYLVGYLILAIYIVKEINWKKLGFFSFVSGLIILSLIIWVLYNINSMMNTANTFPDPSDFIQYAYKTMIYAFFLVTSFLIFLGFINLSLQFHSWKVLFVLAASCTFLSEFSQIFQAIYYGSDLIGSINVIDKTFVIISVFFFYLSIRLNDKRKKELNTDTPII